MSLTYIPTQNMSHEDWLKSRTKGIGGSDAAALVGLNHYSTPYVVWADKTGRLPPVEDNEAMRQGRDLEDYVAKRFEEAAGKKVKKNNNIILNSDYPFALANIDRQVIGEKAGLECKTTSVMNLKRFKNGEFPENYYVQCVHYLAVTGFDRWYLGVLILNQGFYHYTIERDEDEISALMNAEKEFWNTYVVPDVAPPVDGFRATGNAINKVFSNPVGEECALVGSDSMIDNLMALNQTKKQLETEIEKIEQHLKVELKECEVGHGAKYDVLWKPQQRATVSRELLIKEYPEIDISKVSKTSSFRKFSIKERK